MCQTPPDVDHAVHDRHPEQILFTSGSQVTYTCAHGYSADGDARATCGGNGEWLELTLMCTR
ncbi:hypothetical protein DPMN_146209 [Dreissena polymorpha]|uniref:Sushi domain-containing protein n=1 Tax=Dreissena polymorpha TaxID=45954 RepID=A0A9D4IZI2_DREPO|nr:hypothetical protein DPMN_146209 [Dreissena polymorpha]